MAEKKEREVVGTPDAEARFSHVVKPNDHFVKLGKADKPTYEISLVMDPQENPEHKKFLNQIYSETMKEFPDVGKVPYADETDEEGNPTGRVLLKARSKYRPDIYDAKVKKIELEEEIGDGSIVCLGVVKNFYTGLGNGMNLYLQVVQIVKLLEPATREPEDFGIKARQGGYAAPESAADVLKDKNNPTPPDQEESDEEGEYEGEVPF